jgi:hypothetical protein
MDAFKRRSMTRKTTPEAENIIAMISPVVACSHVSSPGSQVIKKRPENPRVLLVEAIAGRDDLDPGGILSATVITLTTLRSPVRSQDKW